MKRSFWFWALIALLVYVVARVDSDPATVPHPHTLKQPPIATPAPTHTFNPVRRIAPPSLSFRGYECTEDCSGHEAGYEWAEDNGIDDPDDCGGNSESFIEGCQAFAEEQQAEQFEDEGEEELE